MNKILIHSEQEKANVFISFVQDLQNDFQSLVNAYNKLGLGKASQTILNSIEFRETSIRKRLATDHYNAQKGSKMSIESISNSIEIPQGCIELNELTIALEEKMKTKLHEEFRLVSGFSHSKLFELNGSIVEINTVELNKLIAKHFQMYAETEREIELYEGLKNLEIALESYSKLVDKFGIDTPIFRAPDPRKFTGLKYHSFNYPNTMYKLLVDPEFVKYKAQ